ncbi:MAG: hypothetical protein ABIH72_00465 [archaeon]
MKKVLLFFIGILLVCSLSLVIADGNCTDSDNGKDYYVRGEINGNDINNYSYNNASDSCMNVPSLQGDEVNESDYLGEFYCDNNIVALDIKNCSCENGVCINQTSDDDDDDLNETDDDDDNDANDDNDDSGNSGAIVTKNKTKGEKKSSFLPWQKRSEDECPEGCSCHGAVTSCKTSTGKTMTIEAGRSGNIIIITIEKIGVETELEVESELDDSNNTKLSAKLSNGQIKRLNLMPDEAQVRVRERARICEGEGNCTVKLQEIKGELMYEFEGNKESRLFALFKKQMKIQARIDAETGEVSKIKKPWWALLASE